MKPSLDKQSADQILSANGNYKCTVWKKNTDFASYNRRTDLACGLIGHFLLKTFNIFTTDSIDCEFRYSLWYLICSPKEKQRAPHSILTGSSCLLPGSPCWWGNGAHLKSWPPVALFFQSGCEPCHPAAHRLTATNPTPAAARYTGSLPNVRMIMPVKADTDTLR